MELRLSLDKLKEPYENPRSAFSIDKIKCESLHDLQNRLINETLSTAHSSLLTPRSYKNEGLSKSIVFSKNLFSSPRVVIASHEIQIPSYPKAKKRPKKLMTAQIKGRVIPTNLLLDYLN